LFTFILVIHVIVSVVLVLVILLQDGKGGDLVSALGGGGSSQTLFGSTGAASFLTKATIALTIVFVLTSLSLAVLKTREQRSVIGEINPAVEKNQPVEVKKEQKKADVPIATEQAKPVEKPAPAAETKPDQPKTETPAMTPADKGDKAKAVAAVKTPEAKPADANKKDNGKK